MIDVNRLRNGTAFKADGQLFLVLKYEFTKMGRGTGNVKVKVRNLKTGTVLIKTYTTGNKVQEISLKRKPLQFLYKDEKTSVFMDSTSFEQIEIDKELIADQQQYLVDGMEVQVLFYEDQPLTVELPLKLSFEVAETGPAEKGNSTANVFKSAVLENGMNTRVPLFIVQGEKVIIDTRSGEYVGRG